MINFNAVRQYYFEKRYKILQDMYRSRDIISYLNCALLDNDREKAEEIDAFIKEEGINYKLHNVAQSVKNKSRLRVAYLIPHSDVTGGLKILIEQSNRLAELGHEVLLYSHSPKPEWIRCSTPYFLVHPDNNLCDVVPYADVVIAGYWDQVIDALRINAPLKYHFAQGDFDIFEFEKLDPAFRNAVTTAYTLPLRILTVSDIMRQKIKSLYGRESIIVPNAVDKKAFYANRGIPEGRHTFHVLLVGRDSMKFKGHEMIIGTLYSLKELGYQFDIQWITPAKLIHDYSPLGLDIVEHISPSQEEIGKIYRGSDIFICGSYYEAFPLPPMEAMTCGCPVITSDNGGVREYATDGYNCLIFEAGNIFQLAEKLKMLFESRELREKLRKGGIETARKYTWKKSIKKLESEFIRSSVETMQARLV